MIIKFCSRKLWILYASEGCENSTYLYSARIPLPQNSTESPSRPSTAKSKSESSEPYPEQPRKGKQTETSGRDFLLEGTWLLQVSPDNPKLASSTQQQVSPGGLAARYGRCLPCTCLSARDCPWICKRWGYQIHGVFCK